MSKQEKFSFPGLARSIVRPVVKTATTVAKRGEKVVGNVVRLASHTVSGTSKVASGVYRGTIKIAKDAAGVKSSRKTIKKSKK
jgi:hypothetical protein